MTIDFANFTPWASLAGGVLLGVASALFILLNGRVLGISGIVGGLLSPKAGDIGWRVALIAGLLAAPAVYALIAPAGFITAPRIDAGFGLVVLDPPPFTRRKDAVDAAARGYKEINLRGLRLLEPGGLLATFSCSHHVTPEMFESVCRAAAGDAGVGTRVLATLTQARDHPILLAVPETRYLTGLLLQAL